MSRESSLKLVKKSGDIEDSVTIVKSGCPFYFGYQYEQQNNKPEKSINLVASKIPWEQPLSVNDFTKIG